MKIAFMHYHLKPGGVATVIRRQLRAVEDACETLFISGDPPEESMPFDAIRVPGLSYDTDGETSEAPARTAAAVMDALYSKWPEGCDVLHVHNPTLAKNGRLLNILEELKQRGVPLFLQIHDFAEEGRPHVYFQDEYLADCHYGVINARDYDILTGAGLSPKGLHLIPNTVSPPGDGRPSSPAPETDFILYPIRAIRRKNIGESLLLSLFFEKDETLAITLPPNSPADMKSYERWRSLAGELDLAVRFNVGLTHRFTDLVHHAKWMLTTSISEGFGFSFLEPWAAGKHLWGRDLPGITRDFKASGIRLEHLYSTLRAPLSWIDMDEFRDRWFECIHRARRIFDYALDEDRVRAAFERLRSRETMDFGLLDEPFQEKIIRRAAGEQGCRMEMRRLNPCLSDPGGGGRRKERIEINRRTVMDMHPPVATKNRLMEIYRKVLFEPVRQSIDKQFLLKRFLDPRAFSLLQWGAYAG